MRLPRLVTAGAGTCEVRLALLEERVPPFFALVGHVEQRRRVARELLQAGEAVRVRDERRLQEADRRRAVSEDLARPAHALVLELIERHDRVHEAHLERLLRVVLAAQVPNLACLLVADDARELRRAEARIERADARPGLPEARVVGGDRQVADDVQHVPATDGVPRDEGDDRLRHRADVALQLSTLSRGTPSPPT